MPFAIGPQIKRIREAKGLTQKQLAETLGISNSRMSNWELGINRPDADSLKSICIALEVSADELLDIANPVSTNTILTISERLTEVRKSNGYTRARLADELGKPYRTITNYETGEREPGHDYIIKIATMFGVTTDYLLGLSNDPHLTLDGRSNFKLNNYETEHIKKYRALDEHGKEVIDVVLEKETARMEKEQAIQVQATETDKIIKLPDPIQAASAGFGEFIDDDTARWVSVKYNDMTKKADYIMRVAGHSMEPKIYDGQRVLVRQQPAVEPGEIGIFLKEGERYIKIYRGDHLESANPDYPDVPLEEYSRCVGKVLGVLEEDWIVE